DRRVLERVASREEDPGLFGLLEPGDPVLPAWAWLERLLNKNLEGQLTPRFALECAGALALRVLPRTLLDAIWFQFGLAVSGHKKYRRCAVCQDWFELSPEVARTNRRFCSVACKNRAFRERKEHARRLHAGGKALRDIARELETTVSVVR